MSNRSSSPLLFPSPFSKEYWRCAVSELKSTRMLLFAALMIALRVALKSFKIPLGPSLNINVQFFVNALGSAVYGPVVAILAGAVTDTLGTLLFPSGPYFFPFIFTEIAGSLVFALFLYRAEITVRRMILCRFCVNFFVNLLLQTPIMALYYQMVLGKYYALVDLPRIVKNLALFPLESALLILVFRAVVPPLNRMGYLASRVTNLKMTGRTAALLVALTLVSAAVGGGYSIYMYNTTSLSASYSASERLEKNEKMNAAVLSRHPEYAAEETVTVIESAFPRFLSDEVTYTAAVYRADREALLRRAEADGADPEAVRGYSKSKAAKDDALTRLMTVTAVLKGESWEVQSWQESTP